MISLSIFPTEVLEHISSLLNAAPVCRLWSTGDRNIRFKLSNGGISVLRLSWSHASIMPWPRTFIQSIKYLRTLDWRSELITPYCPSLDFTSLPPTLIRLCIHSTDVFCILSAMNCNLGVMFPLLSHLDLSGDRIEAKNLKNLPSNLISLSVVSLGEQDIGDSVLGDLPRSLTDLDLRVCIIDSETGADLPPNLLKLRIQGLEADSNKEWPKKVPRTVQSLHVGINTFANLDTLPPGLQALKFVAYPMDKSDPILPATLTSLSVSRLELSRLPPNLRSLKSVANLNHHDLQRLPKTLTNLQVSFWLSHPDILSMFPPSVKRINIVEDPSEVIQLNPLPLPSNLTFLQLPYMKDTLCQILPQSLRTLMIPAGEITAIGGKFISQLPLLHELHVSVNAIIEEVVPYLRNIPKLYFGRTGQPKQQKLSDTFIHHLLPSTIVGMHPSKETSTHLLSSKNDGPSSSSGEPNSIVELLYLQCATIGNAYPPQTIFPLFVHFPRLTSLSVHSIIDPALFQYLPSCLRFFEITSLSRFPTTQHLGFLPIALAVFKFEVCSAPQTRRPLLCPWIDSDLSHLPKNLQILYADGYPKYLTAALNNYVPPYLHLIMFDWEPLEVFQSPVIRRFGPCESRDTYDSAF